MAAVLKKYERLVLDWWWTIDRPLLLGVFVLAVLGGIVTLAASPLMAARIDLPMYHFAARQILFLLVATALCLAVSFLSPGAIARLGLGVFAASILGLVLVLVIGEEVRGAQRWLPVFGFSVQPSEFLKPGFILVTALVLARLAAHKAASLVPLGLMGVVGALLLAQPDIGQTVLLSLSWLALIFLAGARVWMLSALGAGGAGLLALTYYRMDHVRVRMDGFFNPALGENYQTSQALAAIANGGAFGTGPGDGHYKAFLPDAHTDYVFAVLAEEGGFLLGVVVLALFGALILRALWRAQSAPAHWMQLSIAGLAGLFGLQASISFAVNLNMIPPKGMTLPFLSYGGSSLLASAFALGMILALTRRALPALPPPLPALPSEEGLRP